MKCKLSMNTSPKRRLARNELPYIYCACVHDGVRCAAAWSCKNATDHGRRRSRSSQATVPRCFGVHGCYGAFATKAERGGVVVASHVASVCMVLRCLCHQGRTRRCGRHKPRCHGVHGATAPLLPRRNEVVRSSQATAVQATAVQSYGSASHGARYKKGERSNGRSHFRSPCSQKG